MKKLQFQRAISLLLTLLLVLSLASACQNNGSAAVISGKPQAIIATNVWAGEILLDMLPSDRIKALSAWGDDPVISPTAEKAKAVTNRADTKKPEDMIAMKPDLVIIDTFTDADGSLTKTLQEAGITVLHLDSPTNFDQIKSVITTLAAAVGEPEKGAEMTAAVDASLKAVSDKLAGLKDADKKKVMYYEDYYDASGSSAGMLAAYGAGSPFDAIAGAAGLINVVSGVNNYSAVSKEKVVGEWKPDILIVPSITYGADFSAIDDGGASVIKAIQADELLKTLPAVQNGKVMALTEKYRGSTSQYMVKAVEELAKLAYPDLMK